MTIQRMDNVLIVVEDLDAVIAFFVELGMELEGTGPVEGPWVDAVIGIEGARQSIAMLRIPGADGRIELAMFHSPDAISVGPRDAPANTLGIPVTLPAAIVLSAMSALGACGASGVAGASRAGTVPGLIEAMAWNTAEKTEVASITGGSPTALER